MAVVFVTGGAGYIGSHVVKALGERGFEIVVFDNLSTGHRDAVLHGTFIEGDLADGALLRRALERRRPDAVMHFAASIEVGESVKAPLKYYENNTANAIRLLSAMAAAGVKNFIFSSTAAVYGTPERVPISETEPMHPINPYGRAKSFVETILHDHTATGSLQSISLRYFNAAGAEPSGRIGERHDPESHLIPLILQAAAGRRPHISLFGDDYPTPDGTCLRDYIHVDDLADAHVLALDRLLEGKPGGVYNCGYGQGYSVKEVITTAQQVTGKDIPVVRSPRRPGDPAVLVADSAKIRNELGWKPKYNDLEYIIRTAWNWEKAIQRHSR